MNHYLKMLSNYNLIRQFSLNVCKYNKVNHYDCLGITPKATQGEIKNAYYKLSKQYHPDTNSGNISAAEKFRDIAEAYEILGNIKARKLYDRGISMRVGLNNDSQSHAPANENYKHSTFYHHRNKTKGTKPTIAGKFQHYDMDEWTTAHYSETFTSTYARRQKGRVLMDDKVKTKTENKSVSQLMGVLLFLVVVFGFMYGTDASRRFDIVEVKNTSEEKPK